MSNLPAPTNIAELHEMFPALVPEVQQDMLEALDGAMLTVRSLPRVPNPAGGGTIFEVPQGGETVAVKELNGIVLAYQLTRRFYATKGASGTPPDCYSVDCVTGRGNPGGSCAACPLSEWESAQQGKGQACKQYGVAALLLPGMGLPFIVTVPPTSLKAMDQYRVGILASTMGPLSGVVTSITLTKVEGAGGDPYAKMNFKSLGLIPKEAREAVRGMAAMYKKLLATDDRGGFAEAEAHERG